MYSLITIISCSKSYKLTGISIQCFYLRLLQLQGVPDKGRILLEFGHPSHICPTPLTKNQAQSYEGSRF